MDRRPNNIFELNRYFNEGFINISVLNSEGQWQSASYDDVMGYIKDGDETFNNKVVMTKAITGKDTI